MAQLFNLAKMTTATTGTGTMTLGSAVAPYLSFASAGVTNGVIVTYAIRDGSNSEIGEGTYTTSGTTLSRDHVFNSTNGGSKISLSGGAQVVITASLQDIQQFYNVKSFGAVGDGSTDDTTAIQATFTAAAVANNGVFFPPSVYRVSSAINVTGNGAVFGMGNDVSIIQTTSLTADVFVFQSDFTSLHDLQVTSTVTKTAGSYINVNGKNYCNIYEFVGNTNFFNGITSDSSFSGSSGLRIERAKLLAGSSLSTCINIGNPANSNSVDLILRDLWLTGISSRQPVNGVLITNVGDCTLDHVSTVFTGNGVEVAPGNGQVVQALFITNCFFDSGTGEGIGLRTAGTGQIQLAKISNSWSATNTIGLVLSGTNDSTILNTEVVNCTLSNNTAHGLLINTSAAVNTRVIGGSMSANIVAGFITNPSVNKFLVQGVKLGACGEFAGNGTGLVIGSSNAQFQILGNDVIGNTVAYTMAATNSTTVIVNDNLGIATTIMPSDVANLPTIDTSQTLYTIGGSSGLTLATTASGMLIATDNTNGATALYVTGGGNAALLGQSNGTSWVVSSAPTTSQVGLAYFSTGAVYRITNGFVASRGFYLQYMKTRPNA